MEWAKNCGAHASGYFLWKVCNRLCEKIGRLFFFKVEEVQQTEGAERRQVEKERMGVRKYFLTGVPIADEGCSVFPNKKSDAASPAEYGKDKEENEYSFFLPFFA